MSNTKFFYGLLSSTILAGLTHWLIASFSPNAPEQWRMGLLSSGLFILTCLLLYFFGKNSLKSADKNAFTSLVLASVFGKMIFSLLFLFVYQKTVHPGNKWFVIIFLSSYLIYTSFEVWFLLKLAKKGE